MTGYYRILQKYQIYQATLNIYLGVLGKEEEVNVKEESLIYLLDEELVSKVDPKENSD